MAHARKKLGDWGESVATQHLLAQGYQVITRNWRCQWGEIDLVLSHHEVLHFVEVKTRRGQNAGTPEQAITPRKADKLLKLAFAYISEHELDEVDWQIDMVAVELDSAGKLLRCEHIENAVTAW